MGTTKSTIGGVKFLLVAVASSSLKQKSIDSHGVLPSLGKLPDVYTSEDMSTEC